MKAAYDEATPTCRPNAPSPEQTPAMASSQMPPIERSRESGFCAAW
jgi:hypothetical protein